MLAPNRTAIFGTATRGILLAFAEVGAEDERRLCERSYYEFACRAWDVLEPQTEYSDNWHIEYLCGILQGEIERIAEKRPKDRDIIINIPPRSMKSFLCTILLAPWAWTRFPHLKFINVSYEEGLAIDLCLKSRRLIESEWYQGHWGGVYKLTSDQNTKKHYDNDKGGTRYSCPTNSITGYGCDVLIYDDPQNPKKASSEVERENTKVSYGQTGYSRLNSQEVGLRLLIQQRLSEDDLTGHLLANSPDKYHHICIPSEESETVSPAGLRKYYEHGLFWPARFPWTQLEDAKLATNLGAYGYAGQYLQRPAPPEGGTFKRVWWRFWRPADRPELLPPSYKDEQGVLRTAKMVVLPEKFDLIVDSWDTAIESGTNNDPYAGFKVAKLGAQKFWLDGVREKMDYPEAKRRVKEFWERTPKASALIIEKSSSGPAIKADLDADIPGIITIHTGRLSKEDRVHIHDAVPYAAQVEAGSCYLPHPAVAKWVDDFVEEHAKFPKSKNDDAVDASSQASNYLTQVRPVWPYYQPADPAHHRKLIPDELRVTGRLTEQVYHYGAIFLTESLEYHLLAAVWSRYKQRLHIYGAIKAKQSHLDAFVQAIHAGMFRRLPRANSRVNAIYGNDLLFGKSGSKNAASYLEERLLRATTQRTYISEPRDFNRMGAITLANLMFSRDHIVVGDAADEASRQFSAWYIDGDSPAQGFPYCECLVMIVNEINRMTAATKPEDGRVGYKRVKEAPAKKATPQPTGFMSH